MNKTEQPDKKNNIAGNKAFRRLVLVLFCFILLISTCECTSVNNLGIYILDVIRQKDSYVREIDDPNWAAKIELTSIPNFHKVSDDLYRGAQPTKDGMKELEKFGIKTVVNLRSLHSDKDELENTQLNYTHIKMTPLDPEMDDIILFLDIITDSNNTPVFVHCQHGADRTGVMCAIYRVIEQGWTKEYAVEEMTKGGFGFHSAWNNLADYIRNLDIDKIKQQRENED